MSDVAQPFARDWTFLTGDWDVTHRKLSKRLTEDNQWHDFEGTCQSRPGMAGQAQVDDYVLCAPEGTYRAMAVRAFDMRNEQWSIWWVDSRYGNSVGEPVIGRFSDKSGLFFGNDIHDGKSIRVRFIWSDITEESARWEQSYSPDGGDSWEPNWTMNFKRRLE